ncbi:GDSL-type esterase/lipase family protein [Streptomyces sp. M19]
MQRSHHGEPADGQPGRAAPQIDALNADTQLVTVTIGGNDVNYLGSLNTYSCQTSGGANCGEVNQDAINQSMAELPDRMKNVVNTIHTVAPQATVLLVNYVTILPDTDVCAGVPLTGDQLAFENSIATRVADATANAATEAGATLVDLAGASHGHDACSAEPWVENYTPRPGAPRTTRTRPG